MTFSCDAKKGIFCINKDRQALSEFKKTVGALPSSVKWIITLMIGACISAIVGIVMTVYFNIGLTTINEINPTLKVQFILDVMIIALLIIFIGLVIREANS